MSLSLQKEVDKAEALETLEGMAEKCSPLIFDAHYAGEEVPAPFNSVLITLPAAPDDPLHWDSFADIAHRYIEKGLFILWQLDLGLFRSSHWHIKSNLLTLSVALDYFIDFIWDKFHAQSLGVCLYRGTFDFFHFLSFEEAAHAIAGEEEFSQEQLSFLGNKEATDKNSNDYLPLLWKQKIAMSYLRQLTFKLKSFVPCYLAIDGRCFPSAAALASFLTDPAILDFNLIAAQLPFACRSSILWAEAAPVAVSCLSRTIQAEEKGLEPICWGILFPSTPLSQEQITIYETIFAYLNEKNISFQIIAEELLTISWSQLDYLVVLSATIEPSAKRKLAGFVAASGTVVVVGEGLELSNEIKWESMKALL